jgi:hypothetical protein
MKIFTSIVLKPKPLYEVTFKLSWPSYHAVFSLTIGLQFCYPVFLKRNIPHVTDKIIEIPECCYMEILMHFLLVVKVNINIYD